MDNENHNRGKNDCEDNGNSIITLIPQNKDDLFTIYQIIDKKDEVIFKKLFKTKKDEIIRKTITNFVAVRLRILSHEFDIKEEYLRYKGITVTDGTNISSANVPLGKFLSFNITYEHQFTIFKRHFNKCARKLLKEAIDSEMKLRHCCGGSARRNFWHLLIDNFFNYFKTKN
ncbi:ASB_collapsed_G0005800.mRNA.1.CDS.1 [Saccharomyces cerevisiae]|nr:ASB_collapsed_G0005800.mRNA.1.CDS.1 [Saccharomyces cerevisiae]